MPTQGKQKQYLQKMGKTTLLQDKKCGFPMQDLQMYL